MDKREIANKLVSMRTRSQTGQPPTFIVENSFLDVDTRVLFRTTIYTSLAYEKSDLLRWYSRFPNSIPFIVCSLRMVPAVDSSFFFILKSLYR